MAKEVILAKHSTYPSNEFYLSKEKWEMLSQYLLYVCIHIGNSRKIGSTYSVLVCYRNSALWFHLMLPGSSHKGRENNHSFFTFSCQPLFYIALSLLFPVTSFQSWRLLVYLISPSTETIPCLWLSLIVFVSLLCIFTVFFFSISFWDTVTCNACGVQDVGKSWAYSVAQCCFPRCSWLL